MVRLLLLRPRWADPGLGPPKHVASLWPALEDALRGQGAGCGVFGSWGGPDCVSSWAELFWFPCMCTSKGEKREECCRQPNREAVRFLWHWHLLEQSWCHQGVRGRKKTWKTQGQHPGCFHEQSLLLRTTRQPANARRLRLSKLKFAPRALARDWHPNSRAGRAQEGRIFLPPSLGRVGRMLSPPISAWSPQCFLFCSG